MFQVDIRCARRRYKCTFGTTVDGVDRLNLLFRCFVGLELDAAASIKSFMRKDAESGEGAKSEEQQLEDQGRNKEVNFHSEKFSNATHQSVKDGEARLYRKAKGKEARLSFMGHLLTENRNGLIVQASVSQATGKAEREVALAMLDAEQSLDRHTLGAEKNYDTKPFVADCRERKVTAYVAQKYIQRLMGEPPAMRVTRLASGNASKSKSVSAG